MHKLPEQWESNTQDQPHQPYLSCSPVTSTSASRSSSAAFFCMVFPIPSMSLQTQGAQQSPRGRTNKQPHAHTKTWFLHGGQECASLFSAVHVKRNQCTSLKKKGKWEACNQTSKQCPRVCPYPSNTIESGEELFCLLFLCGMRMVFIPSRERSSRNTCSHSAVTARRSARSSITLPTLPRRRADFHPDARMRTLFPVWLRVTWVLGATHVERSSAAACRRAAPDRFAADSHGTGPTHVFLHGATSARPPSPRIGRILASSLGELTGGAGLTSRAGALDSFAASSGGEENDGCGVDGAVRVHFLTSDFKDRICCDAVILMKF